MKYIDKKPSIDSNTIPVAPPPFLADIRKQDTQNNNNLQAQIVTDAGAATAGVATTTVQTVTIHPPPHQLGKDQIFQSN